MIVYEFGISVKDYAELGKHNNFPLLELCPNCQKAKKVIEHGYYSRWCWQLEVWIKRYFCKACSRSFSLLPSFLCQGICEPLEVVEKFLQNRSQGKTYKECSEVVGRPGLSYQRAQYWCKRWQKKISKLRGALPLKEMKKTLDIFQHLSLFFHLSEDSGRLFEAVNRYFSLHFYRALL